MGTKYIRKEIITDTYTTVTVEDEYYTDFEDGDTDGYWGMALKVAFGLADESDLDAYAEEDVDISSLDVTFETRHVKRMKDIEVCEWCESPFCDGDYTCSEAPDEDEDEEEEEEETTEEILSNLRMGAVEVLLEDAPEIESKI